MRDIPYEPGEPLSCQQIRDLDSFAIEHLGIPGLVLMENAGRVVAAIVYGSLLDPPHSRVLVLCGAGNNGGDGFVVARHLYNAGVPVTVALAVAPERLRGDAEINLGIVERIRIPLLRAFEVRGMDAVQAETEWADVIVDGLLGTGSKGPPRGVHGDLIRLANAAPRARRVAIDIPSGLDGDTGEVYEPCFRAHATVTMVAAKIGFNAPQARAVVGRVIVVDIGAPRGAVPGGEKNHGSPVDG